MPLQSRDFVESVPKEFVDIIVICAIPVDRERNTCIFIDGDVEEVLNAGFWAARDQDTDRKMVLCGQFKDVRYNLYLMILALALI